MASWIYIFIDLAFNKFPELLRQENHAYFSNFNFSVRSEKTNASTSKMSQTPCTSSTLTKWKLDGKNKRFVSAYFILSSSLRWTNTSSLRRLKQNRWQAQPSKLSSYILISETETSNYRKFYGSQRVSGLIFCLLSFFLLIQTRIMYIFI